MVAIGAVGVAEARVRCVGIGGAIVGVGMGVSFAETTRRTVVRERGTVDTLAHGWVPEREASTRLEAL